MDAFRPVKVPRNAWLPLSVPAGLATAWPATFLGIVNVSK
jgi:hypothetical protein